MCIVASTGLTVSLDIVAKKLIVRGELSAAKIASKKPIVKTIVENRIKAIKIYEWFLAQKSSINGLFPKLCGILIISGNS